MWPAAFFVTLVANCMFTWPAISATTEKKTLYVGYLSNARGPHTGRQGLSISGAVSYAIDKVNNDTSLLPNHTLQLLYNDTYGETLNSTHALTEQWRKGAVAFFGPEDSCFVEATVASAWNLPMISYKCGDHTVSDKKNFPTFARTYPTEIQITKSIISLLDKYGWKKFSIIYQDIAGMKTVADTLEKYAKNSSFTVNHKIWFMKKDDCCESGLKDCCGVEMLPSIVDNTYMSTRIYVFIGISTELVYFMNWLQMKGLLRTGEYMVIYGDLDAYSEKELHRYVWLSLDMESKLNYELKIETTRYLLIIAPTPVINMDYRKFEKEVNIYNNLEPFKFGETVIQNRTKFVSIYAAHLYDSVMLYAKALNEVLANGGSETDGKRIIETIISGGQYTSIRGVDVTIDKNGDSEGNFSVLALVDEPDPSKQYSHKNRTFPRFLAKVGTFQRSPQGDLPKFYVDPGKTIMWQNGKPPLDEPPCGYRNENCIPSTHHTRVIVASTLLSILFTICIAGIILYKNWKYEQEISGLLWKIDLEEVKMGDYPGSNYHIAASRSSLQSHLSSLESRSCYPSYAPTATYKGIMVVMKRWRFRKKTLEITRETMKEMRNMRTIHHHNVNTFHGACIETNNIHIFTEYCARGSLPDILENEDLKLDSMFIASLIFDLIKGMTYLHDSELKVHGNLKSSNCVVTSRWVLQVSDFGLHNLRRQVLREYEGEDQHYFRLLWTAPEFLRALEHQSKETQPGDVYAFGIILHEIIDRNGPFGNHGLSSKEIIERVKNPIEGNTYFRPDTSVLECQGFIVKCMERCWSETPEERPTFTEIRTVLKTIREGRKNNIFDHMMSMMEKYANNLEELVDERTAQLMEEKKKTEGLLHRMLPQSVAAQLMRKEPVAPESFEAVTIYFSDIVGFTEMSAQSTPLEVVNFLNDLYTTFDAIIRNYDVYKVETIGDAYMVVSGLPIRNGDNHAGEIASMALELLQSIRTFKVRHRPDQTLKLRIGIHTGPVVAGVVGITMPRYCLFGDTVNTASRMESTGEALRIHISQQCREHLEKLGGYAIVERGRMKIKGKGEMITSWLISQTPETAQKRKSIARDMTPPMTIFSRIPDGESHRRSPKLGPPSWSLSMLNRRNSSIPRMAETDSNGYAGPPAFLNLNQESPSVTDSPCRRHRSPGRGRSYSIDKEGINLFNSQRQSNDGGILSDSSISPDRKRESREVMFEGVSDELSNKSDEMGSSNVAITVSDNLETNSEPRNLLKNNEKSPPLTNGCVSPAHRPEGDKDLEDRTREDVVTPLLKPVNSGDENVANNLKLNNHLDKKGTNKRWRSCDEIAPKRSLRGWVTGLFNGGSDRGNNVPHSGKTRNHFMIREQDTESVV